MGRKNKQLALPPLDARHRKAALLAIAHLDMATAFLDMLTEDPDPRLAELDDDLGTTALELSARVRAALAEVEMGEQP
jgi:hypothetical protein